MHFSATPKPPLDPHSWKAILLEGPVQFFYSPPWRIVPASSSGCFASFKEDLDGSLISDEEPDVVMLHLIPQPFTVLVDGFFQLFLSHMPDIEKNAVLVILNDESSISASVVPSEGEEGVLEGVTAWKPVLACVGYVSNTTVWTVISSMLSQLSEASSTFLYLA